MNEVFDKIIDKLENKRKKAELLIMENPQDELDRIQTQTAEDFASAYKNAIEIVKQEADQYEECYKDCGDCEAYNKEKHHCPKFCKVIKETVKEIEENHNGWIPCSERLPDSDKNKYIVQKTNGIIDILGFTKDAYKLSRYDFAEYKGKKKQLFYGYDSEYGYIEWECEAWQPLPQPYQLKGE